MQLQCAGSEAARAAPPRLPLLCGPRQPPLLCVRSHSLSSHCHTVTLSRGHTVTVSRCVCDCVTRGAGVCLGLGVTVSTDQVAAAGTRHPASQAGYWLAAALG